MMKRKILSVVLACLMILSVAPVSIFADAGAAATCPGAGETHTTSDNATFIGYRAPACTKMGGDVYKCDVCGDYFMLNIEDELGHDLSDAEYVGNCKDGMDYTATCQNEGCDYEVSVQVVAPGAGHDWKYVEVVTPPTIAEDGKVAVIGEAKYVCDNDGCEEEMVVDCFCDHDSNETLDAVPPSCSATGLEEGKACSKCGFITVPQEVVDKTSHTPVSFGGQVGDCVNDIPTIVAGTKCDVCGEHILEPDDKGLPHNWEGTDQSANCTEWGGTWYVCSTCGETKSDVVQNPLGHTTLEEKLGLDTFEEAVANGIITIVTHKTCTVDGVYTYTCGKNCGTAGVCTDTVTYIDEAEGHNEVTVTACASCAIYGYTFTYCTNDNCDYAAATEKVIDGITYRVGDDKDDNGIVCGDAVNLKEVVPDVEGGFDPDVHSHLVYTYVDDKEPTCTADAYAYVFCEDCDYSPVNTVKVPALGHDYDADNDGEDDWVANNAADTHTKTCCRTGCTAAQENHTVTVDCSGGTATCQKYAECTVCGQEYGDYADHIFDVRKNTVAPVCGTQGYTVYGCSCDEACTVTENRDFTTFTHDPEVVYYSVQEAHDAGCVGLDVKSVERVKSCTLDGLTEYECDCGTVVVVVTLKSHTHGAWVDNHDGTHTKTCTLCADGTEGKVVTEACSGGTATCTADAVCTKCGAHYELAFDHDYSEWVYSYDTENNVHRHIKTCANNSAHVVSQNCYGGTATCTTGKICEGCGEEYTDPDPHVFTKTHTEPAKCTAYGYEEYRCNNCAVCDAIKVAYIPELGHHEVDGAAVEANCQTDWWDAYKWCDNPGCDYTTIDVQDPVEHQNADGVLLENSCAIRGETEDYVCAMGCGQPFDVSCKVSDKHEYTLAANCEEEGYLIVACKVCGHIYSETIYDEIGHDYDADNDGEDDWVYNYNGTHTKICSNPNCPNPTVTEACSGGVADCENAGECTVCGGEYIPATEHAYGEWVSNDDGTHTKTCANPDCPTPTVTESCVCVGTYDDDYHWDECECGYVDPDTYEEHDWVESHRVEACPIYEGYIIYGCNDFCGVDYKTETIPVTDDEAVAFTFDIVNASVDAELYPEQTTTFVNSSLLAVTVNITGLNGANAYGFEFRVNYDKNDLDFEGYEFVNDTFNGDRFTELGIYGVVDHNGYVDITANTENYVNAEISAEGEALVVLYFRVDLTNRAEDKTSFWFSDIVVSEAGSDEKVHADGVYSFYAADWYPVETIDIDMFLDANGDGDIDLDDVVVVSELIENDEYLVNADVNKDGVIDFENDFLPLYGFLAAENEDDLLDARP